LEQNELRQLWNMLRKRWIIVLSLPLIAALTIGVMSAYVITPVYQASTTLIVERKDSQTVVDPALAAAQVLVNNSVLQQHIKNNIEIAKSRTVEKNVLKELNSSLTVEDLDKLITVTQVKATDLLSIDVTNTDPALAASIANSTAQQFSKAVTQDNLKIVDAADVPIYPVTPKKSQNVFFAFLVGLIASLSLVFVQEYLDNSIKTSSDVKTSLGIPCLGLIGTASHSLMTLEEPKSTISESYRSIRTNLEFESLDSVTRKLLITSAGPGEGKSFTVANLAVSMAQSGKSVLIIDADLRNPTQHKLFGLANRQGLSEALTQEQDVRDYLQETAVPGLRVLTGGPVPSNPAELVGSDRMKRLIEAVSGQFDRVIIDTPAVIEVTDATILAQQVDGVILVLASGVVNKGNAQTAKEHLENVGAKMLGAVLNKVT